MNTPLNIRFSAAIASMVITFCLISTVASMGKHPAADVALAQAATTTTVR